MANKEALRELQSRLAERLQAARTQERGKSWLAVECGGHGLLFTLKDAGEIFTPVPISPVPHVQRWFMGVANLRGHLHGVVDLAGFLGLRRPVEPVREGVREHGRDPSRLVVFNASMELNCALWVDRLAGLRSEAQLTPEPEDGTPRPAFVGARLRDAAGTVWQELHLAELAGEERFLSIVA